MGGQDPSCALDGRQMSRAGQLSFRIFKCPALRLLISNPVNVIKKSFREDFCSLNRYGLPKLSQAMTKTGGGIPAHIRAATEKTQAKTVGPLENLNLL
jgi:hypothetical protein